MQQGVYPPTLYKSELDKLTTWQAERNNKQQLLPLILVKQDHLWLEWFISDNSNLLPSSQSRIPFPAQSVHTFVYQSVFCLALLQHHFLKQRNLQFRQICSYIEFPCIFSHSHFMWQGALYSELWIELRYIFISPEIWTEAKCLEMPIGRFQFKFATPPPAGVEEVVGHGKGTC